MKILASGMTRDRSAPGLALGGPGKKQNMHEHTEEGLPKPKRRRVPNAERSATTRAKLIEATIKSLYELGYHQTTTVLAAERAGVSRGAMLHQFPTKADLMMAAAYKIRDMRLERHQEKLGELEKAEDKFLALIDVLWEGLLSSSGVARIELMLSTRSDPDLCDRFEVFNDEIDRNHKKRVWELCEAAGMSSENQKQQINAFVQLYAAALRGLAIDALRPASRDGAGDSVELLKRFQAQFFEQILKSNG